MKKLIMEIIFVIIIFFGIWVTVINSNKEKNEITYNKVIATICDEGTIYEQHSGSQWDKLSYILGEKIKTDSNSSLNCENNIKDNKNKNTTCKGNTLHYLDINNTSQRFYVYNIGEKVLTDKNEELPCTSYARY